jgi:hypothetical protein
MPSPFDLDFAAADALFEEAFGVAIAILREGGPATSATAEVVMREVAATDGDDPPPTSHETRDYLIAVSAYIAGGQVVKPRQGDRIRETIGGALCEFEVLPSDQRPAVEWYDPAGSRWIVRTKRVQ